MNIPISPGRAKSHVLGSLLLLRDDFREVNGFFGIPADPILSFFLLAESLISRAFRTFELLGLSNFGLISFINASSILVTAV